MSRKYIRTAFSSDRRSTENCSSFGGERQQRSQTSHLFMHPAQAKLYYAEVCKSGEKYFIVFVRVWGMMCAQSMPMGPSTSTTHEKQEEATVIVLADGRMTSEEITTIITPTAITTGKFVSQLAVGQNAVHSFVHDNLGSIVLLSSCVITRQCAPSHGSSDHQLP